MLDEDRKRIDNHEGQNNCGKRAGQASQCLSPKDYPAEVFYGTMGSKGEFAGVKKLKTSAEAGKWLFSVEVFSFLKNTQNLDVARG